MLLLAGLPGGGIGLLQLTQRGGCTKALCQVEPVAAQPVMEMSCCSLTQAFEQSETVDKTADKATNSDYCPMSGGPCRCGVSPADDTPSRPKAPLSSSSSDVLLGLHTDSQRTLNPFADALAESTPTAAFTDGLTSLRTHNETQALLGIWHT